MPVSRTATVTPAPVNVEVRAPVTSRPQVSVRLVSAAASGLISRVFIAGATASTSGSLSIDAAARSVSRSKAKLLPLCALPMFRTPPFGAAGLFLKIMYLRIASPLLEQMLFG